MSGMLRLAALTFVLLLQQYTPPTPEWNQPVEPFRIAGNLYYVGASGVSSFLVTTPDGLILIDTGFRETVPLIEASIKKLGFRFEDVKLLLEMHAHYDHVAGLADVKTRTKARMLVNPGDVPLLERGGLDDFAFGNKFSFQPVKADGLLRDGEPVGLGGVMLTPHVTPGHTKRATSFTMTVRDGNRDYHVVLASSITAPDYQLVDNPKYPNIIQDYEATFATLRKLPREIFVSQHGMQFDLEGKIKRRAQNPSVNPFVDPDGYKRFVDQGEAAIRKTVAEQQAQKAGKTGKKSGQTKQMN
jgi:metallo-beta-lactamase class B